MVGGGSDNYHSSNGNGKHGDEFRWVWIRARETRYVRGSLYRLSLYVYKNWSHRMLLKCLIMKMYISFETYGNWGTADLSLRRARRCRFYFQRYPSRVAVLIEKRQNHHQNTNSFSPRSLFLVSYNKSIQQYKQQASNNKHQQ